MFRHPALRPLSREHQQALFHARELRWHATYRAEGRAPANPGAATAFLAFARGTLRAHFEREEKALLPALYGRGPEGAAAAQRLLREHTQLRAEVAALAAAEPPTAAAELSLAGLLHDHVRYEERELFPLVERLLSEDELTELARRLG